MKTRNFQEISDFCKMDATFRVYHDLPKWASEYPSRKKYDYYNREFAPKNVSRAGTFLFHQAWKQFCRFMGWKETHSFSIYVERTDDGFRNVDYKYYCSHFTNTFVVFGRLDEKGVRIHFDHPFDWDKEKIVFHPRSHRPFTKEGVFAEAMAYIDKNILLPKGRYRTLQLKAGKTKDEFVKWYKCYRETEKERAAVEHEAMLDRYRKHREPMSYLECYALMSGIGLFDELGADRYERYELASEFCEIMNR